MALFMNNFVTIRTYNNLLSNKYGLGAIPTNLSVETIVMIVDAGHDVYVGNNRPAPIPDRATL